MILFLGHSLYKGYQYKMIREHLTAIAVFILAFFSLTSEATNLSNDSTGQVLLYPYYNVNEGNVTFVSITNTTDVAKAAKVRFREGVSGESVFDFTLYLSPRDVWVGAVMQNGGVVKLSVPADTSCTLPNTDTLTTTDFSAARIDSAYDPDYDGTQSADEVLARLSEGHIEVIELADLPNTANAGDIAAAITHVQSANPVAPADCTIPATFNDTADLGAILDSGNVTASGVTQDFQSPGGGLMGNAAIFNASSGIYFPYNATALKTFTTNPIWWPQSDEVFSHVEGVASDGEDSAGNAISNYRTADNGSTLPSVGGTLNRDLPDLSTPSMAEVSANSSAYTAYSHVAATGEQVINSGSFGGSVPDAKFDKASAVSAALTARQVMGEYITSDHYGTEWIITLPTRYTKVSSNGAQAPFTSLETATSGTACQSVASDFWNREELQATDGVGIPEFPPTGLSALCNEVNVISIVGALNDFSLLSSSNAVSSIAVNHYITLYIDGFNPDGWGFIDLSSNSVTPTVLTAGDASGELQGLPLIGFIAVADIVSSTQRGGVFPLRLMADEQ
jgi:hypothetical protein